MEKRPLKELINAEENAWSLVLEWLNKGRNKYEILEVNRMNAGNALYELQLTTRSPMAAIAFESGGILIDQGWLRILGSGADKICGDLLYWNGLGQGHIEKPLEGAMVVAYDVVGGFFAINGGAFSGEIGDIFYLAPDTLEWEDLQTGYSGFIQWVSSGDLALFYKTTRWDGWETDLKRLNVEQGMNFYPPLWTIGDVGRSKSRKPVPLTELWELHSKGELDIHT